jgi:hypothetical protein
MAAGIPTLFGYHGNELTAFDQLLGGKGVWSNQTSQTLWNMLAIRFVVLTQPQEVPGYHLVMGPVKTFHGEGYLYEADSTPPYVRVVPGAAKIPEAQLAATASDPRFPFDRLAVYSDTASLSPEPLDNQIPAPSDRAATVTAWRPGRMEVTVSGQGSGGPAKPEYLVVAENWYPGWRATVDGAPVQVHRAQNTLLSVVLPPEASNVTFEFHSDAYGRGRLISLLSLAGVIGMFAVPLVRRGRQVR